MSSDEMLDKLRAADSTMARWAVGEIERLREQMRVHRDKTSIETGRLLTRAEQAEAEVVVLRGQLEAEVSCVEGMLSAQERAEQAEARLARLKAAAEAFLAEDSTGDIAAAYRRFRALLDGEAK